MDKHLERYGMDKILNEKYGPIICRLFDKTFDHTGITKEEQYKGGDIITTDGTYIDMKWSQYVNDNIDVETRNEHHSHTKAWWEEGNFDVIFAKRMSFNDKYVYLIHTTTEAIRNWAATSEKFKKRKEYAVSGNGSFIKNFATREFVMGTNAEFKILEMDSADLPKKYSKYSDIEMHQDTFNLPMLK